MSSYWCETAIVDGVPQRSVRVEESAGLIARVEVGVGAKDQDTRLFGLVLPGLANGHSHAFHRALRGRTNGDGGTFWDWRRRMYAIADRLTPQKYFELGSAVFAEMVAAGYTVVGEFHYVHHATGGLSYAAADMEVAVLAAAATAGIRITLLDTLYLSGGLADDGAALPLTGSQARFSDGSVDAWNERRSRIGTGTSSKVGAAIHSVRAVTPSDVAAVRTLVGDVPVHAHVSEQPRENLQSLAAWGWTPTEVFADAGLLGRHFTAIHGTHLSESDIGILGGSGSTVCFCPTTERDLADGIGPASALAAAGVRISLGSDLNAVIDPFEEIRGLEMGARAVSGERGQFSPRSLLSAATSAGYGSLGWDGGEIRLGAVCDLVSLRTRTARTAGTSLDQLWLAATGADIDFVIVGGRQIVTAGNHILGNIGDLLSDALEQFAGSLA